MHFHAHRIAEQRDHSNRLVLRSRLSTDLKGITLCLGLQAEARIDLDELVKAPRVKISPTTLFTLA
jgi:hypothetical protein